MDTNNVIKCTITNSEGTITDQDIALAILKDFSEEAKPGKTIIGIWKDKEEYKQWKISTVNKKSFVRVAVMDTTLLPMIQVDGSNSFTIIGLATGVEADYSDTVMFYSLVAKRISSSSSSEENKV